MKTPLMSESNSAMNHPPLFPSSRFFSKTKKMTIICQGISCKHREIEKVEDVFFAKDHPYCESCFKELAKQAIC